MLGLCACTNAPIAQEPAPPVSQSPTTTAPVVPVSPTPEVVPSPEVSEPVETPTAPFTAPADTAVCGVDLSGMTRKDAWNALQQAAAEYTLELEVDETGISILGQSIELVVDEALFDAYWTTLESGNPTSEGVFTLNSVALESTLSKALGYSAKNPTVVYSKSEGRFVVTPGSNGMDYDIPSIASLVASAMRSLYASCNIDGFGSEVAPAISADDPRLATTAEEANRYLSIQLTYTFTPEGGETSIEQLSAATIASFVQISSDFTVSISRPAIERHVSELNSRYGAADHNGDFQTTGGGTVALTVKYYGLQIDSSALANDIYICLTTGVSGMREAAYLPIDRATLPYGGSYVEIDLTSQQLWVYKDGECVVSTPIVSGCVAVGNRTPTGVFSIYKKAEDCWLAGPTWRDHVDYWMPFYGAYGLHDASWRDEFGGEIYIHEGSHGCPNLPTEIAGQVYHNVSVGTPVIIYGGLTKAVDLTQEIYGWSAYYFTRFDTSFQLDYTLRYDGAEVTFTSDNPEVVTVAADGTVTIHGAGSANITISAAAFTHHTAASLTVPVNISPNCLPENHTYGEWTQTVAPSCGNVGITSRTCSICDGVEAQEIPATGHVFNDDSELCANGCGTAKTDPVHPSADESVPDHSAEDETPVESETSMEDSSDPAQ